MKKINQKRFIKLARRFYTEKDIKRVINFMREHNGFISYLDFVVILSVHKLNLDNTLTYLTQMFQLGVSKIVNNFFPPFHIELSMLFGGSEINVIQE